jgi:predicted DNA-binding transcriptional regulator AlpA
MTEAANKKYLTVDEVAACRPISKSMLHKLRAQGLGPKCFMPTKVALYKLSEVDEWIESHAVSLTSEEGAPKPTKAKNPTVNEVRSLAGDMRETRRGRPKKSLKPTAGSSVIETGCRNSN